jgi:hypothetical protein
MHGPVNVKFNNWFHDIYFAFHKCNCKQKCYAAYTGRHLPTLQNNFSVPSARVQQVLNASPSKKGQTDCSETAVNNRQSTPYNIAEEQTSHTVAEA